MAFIIDHFIIQSLAHSDVVVQGRTKKLHAENKIPAFQIDRFSKRLNEFSEIGKNATGGMDRPFGSAADVAARSWLCELARDAGFTVQIDAVGNLWGTSEHTTANRPAIVIGSHHDSVPNGGHLDGALGVLIGIEVMQSLCESGFSSSHPLMFVSFTAEEPNPFDLSTLGSRAIAGRLSANTLCTARDWNGRPLADAMAAVGGDLNQVALARKSASDIGAFLELHIEQGRRLETRNLPLGVVTDICGIYRELITVNGEANHAGTTQLVDRHDALLASAEMILAVERALLEANNLNLVGTVGRLSVSPNAVNIIPGACVWNVELRGRQQSDVYALRDKCIAIWNEIADKRGVTVERTVILDQQPQPLDSMIIDTLTQAAEDLHIPHMQLASMAGHDATHIASFTRAGMVFVPSIGGKSHCKEEATPMADIQRAFEILARSVVELDATLMKCEVTSHEETV